jgi:prepilin-type N-terminal cleavage/methylation domain-containing protein
MKTTNTNKKGFTIIEVVLVLAIAGLIFMMVFIALPSLQRSQRDTQRSNDIARVQTALNQYQANNRGAIPSMGTATQTYVAGHETQITGTNKPKVGTWGYFYDQYLIVNSGGAQDVFADPDGGFYSLWVQSCFSDKNAHTTDQPCDNGQRAEVTFDNQALGTLSGESSATTNAKDGTVGHSIAVLTNATCRGEVAYYSTGARKVAILYKKEGGGTFCLNN